MPSPGRSKVSKAASKGPAKKAAAAKKAAKPAKVAKKAPAR
jgi:hypothetical protein